MERMDGPSLENGYTMIADELLEAMSAARLGGGHFRVMLAVMRLTYGYGLKTKRITSGQVSKMVRMPRRSVIRIMSDLVDKGVLVKAGREDAREWGLNKRWRQWEDIGGPVVAEKASDPPQAE